MNERQYKLVEYFKELVKDKIEINAINISLALLKDFKEIQKEIEEKK